ncbi:MAG TPA: hypothetical protein DCP28_26525, partial [Cytophagales bacterium]|nr:hypothetical protein [Cytophagales bacterium]
MKKDTFLFVLAVLSISLGGCQNTSSTEDSTPPESAPTVVDVMFEQGETITQSAQLTLGRALKQALQEGGIKEAIPYCNHAALPLTDSIGGQFGIELRRTALRVRNPANQPNEFEKQHLRKYQTMLTRGDSLVPQLEALAGGQFLYTRPIMVQGMCTTCHGEVGNTLKAADYALLQKQYPT